MFLNVQQVREYIDLGVINEVSIMREPWDEPGYSLEFFGKDRSYTLKSARGARRVFKTADAAINTLSDLGIKVNGLKVSIK
ncbi:MULTISPECIES: hypothetical protein [unclassified Nitrosomonas]|uniref:hypothetical protein n=1 Tax=unclassified Nitrosomonas TaxID=2609265 RepID=UPI00089D8F0E|nr:MULTISPECIES: hypothetical protein [unclassified Nitrosomonas]MDV6344763.1 hypothetical protein [Nitrosomonas sp. Is37]SDZ17163.1 hypothetical protein SAMN05421755_11511 [Nitrosomonas sp. Nm33]